MKIMKTNYKILTWILWWRRFFLTRLQIILVIYFQNHNRGESLRNKNDVILGPKVWFQSSFDGFDINWKMLNLNGNQVTQVYFSLLIRLNIKFDFYQSFVSIGKCSTWMASTHRSYRLESLILIKVWYQLKKAQR